MNKSYEKLYLPNVKKHAHSQFDRMLKECVENIRTQLEELKYQIDSEEDVEKIYSLLDEGKKMMMLWKKK